MVAGDDREFDFKAVVGELNILSAPMNYDPGDKKYIIIGKHKECQLINNQLNKYILIKQELVASYTCTKLPLSAFQQWTTS